MQGRGSEALTNEGDPLVNSGIDARKVPVEFAKGYTKGVSDQVKRTYWARQDAQKTADEDFEPSGCIFRMRHLQKAEAKRIPIWSAIFGLNFWVFVAT